MIDFRALARKSDNRAMTYSAMTDPAMSYSIMFYSKKVMCVSSMFYHQNRARTYVCIYMFYSNSNALYIDICIHTLIKKQSITDQRFDSTKAPAPAV